MKLTLPALALTGALATAGILSATTSQPTEDTCSASKATAAMPGQTIVETALAAGQFNTLAAALGAADLVDALNGDGPFTVFAPTDAAFAKLPKGTVETLLKPENKALLANILTYHVVSGDVPAKKVVGLKNAAALNGQRIGIQVEDGSVRVAGVNVVKTDIRCKNGIIHVVDSVMMPATEDIIGTAVEAGAFKTLAAALGAAQLVEALQSEGPFTVFAPTDEAFAALPDGTVETLLKPENRDQLAAILKYHVVAGRIYSDQLENGQHAATLQGSNVEVAIDDRGVRISGANVAKADIETTNGVIHVIDRVLLPE